MKDNNSNKNLKASGDSPISSSKHEEYTDYFLKNSQGRQALNDVYMKFQGQADTNTTEAHIQNKEEICLAQTDSTN